jgi:hypothetical protein
LEGTARRCPVFRSTRIVPQEHERDVAEPAAPRIGTAKRVVDDPVVDRLRLVEGRDARADDFLRLLQYDAVGRELGDGRRYPATSSRVASG